MRLVLAVYMVLIELNKFSINNLKNINLCFAGEIQCTQVRQHDNSIDQFVGPARQEHQHICHETQVRFLCGGVLHKFYYLI